MRIAIIFILLMTAVLAQSPKVVDPKEKELDALMSKSQNRLKKITILTKQIDKMSSSKVENTHLYQKQIYMPKEDKRLSLISKSKTELTK